MNARTERLPDSEEPISLSAYAYTTIRDRILRGELPLGASLSRRKLAGELGMSLLPVSEALQRLENEGIVESRPRVGTRVRVPTSLDIRERYELREALEAQSARLFARKAGRREREEARKTAEHVDAMFNRCFSGGENDPEYLFTVQSHHARFHLLIAELGGCRVLRDAIEKNQVLTFNWLYDVAAHRPPLPARFHRELVEQLCNGDEEAADRAMREHIRHGLEYVVERVTLCVMQAK